MTRARTFLAICALALAIPLVASGCGADDPADRDPREVIEETFATDTEVTSGVVDLTLGGSITGDESGSLSATLAGSFQQDPEADADEPPELDLTGSVTGEGDGESIDEGARLVVTRENAFVEYDGETYEAGEEMFAELSEQIRLQVGEEGDDTSFRQACEEAIRQFGGDTDACEIDVAEDWLTNLENQGVEEVEGVETIHVSGDLDVERVLDDIGQLAAAIPGFSLEGFQPSQLAGAVPEASFDLYSGVDDEVLRRLDLRLVIDPAAITAGIAALPVERAELDFSLTLSELNEAQTITAPAGPTTPLEDLIGDLGLGGLGAGGPGGIPDLEGDPGDGPGGADVSPEQAQQYLECIQEAEGDLDAINACAEQL